MFRQPFGLYRTNNPWREFERMRRELDQVFNEFNRGGRLSVAPSFPAMNAWRNEEGVVITAELPGVNPEDIDISVVGDTLTLTGSRQPEELGENAKYHRRERGYGKFTRTFQLPFAVEADKVGATFEKGILQICCPGPKPKSRARSALKTLLHRNNR
jgi:HSP20 family protein